jgi:hypothetical protein
VRAVVYLLDAFLDATATGVSAADRLGRVGRLVFADAAMPRRFILDTAFTFAYAWLRA